MPRIFCILLLCLALAGPVFAAERRPMMDDIVITSSATHLLLHGEVRDCCTAEMLQALHRGTPLNFTFFIELDRVRGWWLDRSIISLEVQHTLAYDPQRQAYTLTRQELEGKQLSLPGQAEAINGLRQLRAIKIAPTSVLEPDRNYILRIKAVLSAKTLPLGLHHFIPFLSLANVETDWRQVEFRY